MATRDQGLREGYKWLLKSVITSYLELGQRVEEDLARERKGEEERRKAVRQRLEEKRRREEETGEGVAVVGETGQPPGFVPVADLREGWRRIEEAKGVQVVHASHPSTPTVAAG